MSRQVAFSQVQQGSVMFSLSVKQRLYALMGGSALLLLVFGIAAILGMGSSVDALNRMYLERVVPLQSLKTVADDYAVLADPGFGYLAGFVPAAWLTGRLSQQPGMGDLPAQTGAALAGLVILQLCGLLNLGVGELFGRWSSPLPELIMQFSLGPLLAQILLCITIGLLAVLIRRLLLMEG